MTCWTFWWLVFVLTKGGIWIWIINSDLDGSGSATLDCTVAFWIWISTYRREFWTQLVLTRRLESRWKPLHILSGSGSCSFCVAVLFPEFRIYKKSDFLNPVMVEIMHQPWLRSIHNWGFLRPNDGHPEILGDGIHYVLPVPGRLLGPPVVPSPANSSACDVVLMFSGSR